MVDPRFYPPPLVRTVGEICSYLKDTIGLEIVADGPLDRPISAVASLSDAGPGDISFSDNPAYIDEFRTTRASACLVAKRYAELASEGCVLLVTPEPYMAYACLANMMYPDLNVLSSVSANAGVHETAQLGEHTQIDQNVSIAPGVAIGSGTRIGVGAVIGENVVIGRNCEIGSQTTVTYCLIGDNVVLHPGVRVGQDGFGFAIGKDGHKKIPQLGRVIIQDDVEIGANSCVDRGAIPDTVIGEGTKIDNLVQIGHNVSIGRHCLIAGHGAIAGSTILEDFVMMGGHSCIAGHLRIGKGARIAGGSAVMRDVPAGASHGGVPARRLKTMLRETLVLEQLTKERSGGK